MPATISYLKTATPKCMGNITIKDHEYAIESCTIIDPLDRVHVAVALTKQSDPDTSYNVYQSNDGDLCLSGGPNAGWECDCGDYLNRHAGLSTLGCKHIQAVVAEPHLVQWMVEKTEELNGPTDEELANQAAREAAADFDDSRFAYELFR